VEEDAKLTDAVKKHGKDWVSVAALVPGRTNIQCRNRWTDNLSLNTNRKVGKWAAEEDAKLIDAVQKHGKDWVAVAALVSGRNNKECRQRWADNLEPNTNRKMGKWTAEEDAKLIEGVRKHGKEWVAVAALVPGRMDKLCRQRWADNLEPNTDRKVGRWREEEDAKLTDAVQKHGKDWVAVAALVPGRNNVQCCHRWVDGLDPGTSRKKGKWTAEEDAKLIDAVSKHGNDWVAVAALVPGRTNEKCSKRWANYLDPTTNRTNGVHGQQRKKSQS
jgi:myb proto-oncogene protein